ncbi:MAG: hypothetical protein J1F33_02285 [Clostridiales bacterium]|nr:hypothetical protein [Clostridiales bacterium]
MEKDKNGISFRDIDSTLTDGKMFVGKGWLVLIIVLSVLIGLCFVSFIAMLISASMESNPDYKDTLIYLAVLQAPLLGYSVVVLFYAVQKKKLKRWLQDAVILNAKVEKVFSETQMSHPGVLIVIGATAIKVRFTYDGHKRVRYSEYKGRGRALHTYNKFVGKIVRIAYSPKYDKVMLLKPDKR